MAKRTNVGLRTVRRRPDGTIYAQLRWMTPEGREETETLGWTTPGEAELAAERKEAAIVLGVPLSVSPEKRVTPSIALLIGEYADDLETRDVGCQGYRTNVENRGAALTRHLGKIAVDRITLRDLESYVAKRRKELGGRCANRYPRRSTVADELRLLRRVLTTTQRWGRHTATFPGMPSFKGWPDDARPPRRLTYAEHQQLVTVAGLDRPALARLINFMGYCPRRPVAVFAMRRQDCVRALDPKYTGNDLVYFERDKGGVGRGFAPLLPEARAILQDHLRDTIGPPEQLVWISATGLPYTANLLAAALRYLNPKSGVPDVHPYDLRKLAAVRAYNATNHSLRATCRFTGHREAATLLRHYLFDEEDAVSLAVRGGKGGE